MEALIGVLLGTWLLVSIVAHALPRRTRLRRFWFAWGVPEWRFFAPDPATFDYRLIFRVLDHPHDVRTFSFEERNGFYWLWNPGAREQKILRDLADSIQMASSDADSDVIPESVILDDAYVLLLNFCSLRSEAGPVQFGVVRVEPGDGESIAFLSRCHSLS